MSVSVYAALRTFKKHFLIALAVIVGFTVGHWVNAAFYTDDAPAQPIAFSHQVHATDNGIPCMHCHVHAARSTSAGVPSVNKCMNCHSQIHDYFGYRAGTSQPPPEIVKVFDYWTDKEPIPWVKVHDLPDFAYFPHKRHVQAGVQCQECHSEVQNMAVVQKVAPLKMKWCVGCHTERQVEHGRDCWTCHK